MTFEQASDRVNISSKEKLSVIMGKIKKWFTDLKSVAFSGSYEDLSNKPDLKTVATTGNYSDLSNKPTIPTALKNPQALTFTGGVTGSYDGSAAKSVKVPSLTNNLLATAAGTALDAAQGKVLDGKIAQINSNLPLQTYRGANIKPVALNTNYTYQNDSLKGKHCIVAIFYSSVGNVFLTEYANSKGMVYVQENNQHWGGEIDTSFDSSTGTITFRVLWIGSSQNLNNFALTGVLF